MDRWVEGSFRDERLGIGDCWFHVTMSLRNIGLGSCYPALFGGHVAAV